VSTLVPDSNGFYHGIAGLHVKGALVDGRPVVAGSWGPMGLGYSTVGVRQALVVLAAACDEADAMAARQAGEGDG
jgi:hypothetical protein